MAMKARYTVVNGKVISQSAAGARRVLVVDSLGSVVALLDASQSQTDSFAYWPYGEVRSRVGATSIPFQFIGAQGYYSDSSTRLYVRERTFSTIRGSWLTPDPIGELALYSYCNGSPTSCTDRSGLQGEFADDFALWPLPLISVSRCLYIGKQAKDEVGAIADNFCDFFNLGERDEFDICNAMMHCMWMCLISKRGGKECAKFIGDEHEETALIPVPEGWLWRPYGSPDKPRDKCMDLYNNVIGRNCAGEPDCYQCCLQHARKGQFQILSYKKLPKGWSAAKTDCKKSRYPTRVKRPLEKGKFDVCGGR